MMSDCWALRLWQWCPRSARARHEEPPTTVREAQPQRRIRLWFAIFAGPLTWSADFLLGYALTGHACRVQSISVLLVLSMLAFGATLAGLRAFVS